MNINSNKDLPLTKNSSRKLLFVDNVDRFFISHRLVIAKAAAKEGWDVYVACIDTGRSEEITSCNIKFIDLPYSRSGTNFIKELKSLVLFFNLYRRLKPDVVHHITLKPVIYGSLIAKVVRIKGVLNAVSGLGYVFTDGRDSFAKKTIARMLRFGLSRKNVSIIFQNKDDYRELKSLGIISAGNDINFIKGSGVNLTEFGLTRLPNGDRIKILFPARMLWDKGVKELKEASEILRPKYLDKVSFILAGLADIDNKAGVPVQFLRDWEFGEYVKWVGYQRDIIRFYREADIVVLPSYREGIPKSLIEACAIGRPIVTTDAIGCRECVEEGKNGFAVPLKSGEALASALEKLIQNKDLREKMGEYSRYKAEREFDQEDVIKIHLQLYNKLINSYYEVILN